MNPGEYVTPLTRKTFVNVPVISGYVASRMRATESVLPVISGEDTTMMVTIKNTGANAVSLKLRQTTDSSISGTRIDVVSGIVLVVDGHRTVTTTGCFQSFLELFCYAGGPSSVRMQIDSQRKWEHMGFDKVNDATFYPSSLWSAKSYPAAPKFPGT